MTIGPKPHMSVVIYGNPKRPHIERWDDELVLVLKNPKLHIRLEPSDITNIGVGGRHALLGMGVVNPDWI